MQKLTRLLSLVVLLGAVESAWAQFDNRSIGFGVGAFKLSASDDTFGAEPISFGMPLYLEGSYYLADGFDVFARVPLMILIDPIAVYPQPSQIWGTGGQVGFRYLFLEESIRPWLGAEVAYIHIFRNVGTTGFVGLGPVGGVDFFATDNVSIGPRAFFDLYLMLNTPLRYSYGAAVSVHIHF